MNGFAIRVPLDGRAPAPAAAARRDRLDRAGWHVETLEPPFAGGLLAWQGGAARADAGPILALGLAHLDPVDRDPAGAVPDMDRIARAWQRAGRGALDTLGGAFAVVLLDRDTGRIEACRDLFGIMPLYYLAGAGALTLGSDIRAVLHLSGQALEPDRTRIADFVAGREIDATRTAFAGLSRLPAAHRLEIAAPAGPAPAHAVPVIARHARLMAGAPVTSAEAPVRLAAALEAATAAALAGPGRIGAMLSGGLDSSALVAFAAGRPGADPLPTLSFVYGPDKPYDERAYIDAVNAALPTAPHAIALTAPPDLQDMAALIEEQMDLFLGFGIQKSRRIYREAAELGLDALLDGHGGDEVISHGYDRLVELAAAGAWIRLWRELRGAARVHGRPLWPSWLVHVLQYGGMAPRNPLRRILLRIARRVVPARPARAPDWSAELIAPDLRATLDPETRYAPPTALSGPEAFRRAEALEHRRVLEDPVMQHGFEVLHRSAAAAGIAPRYPFYDSRLVALSLAMPSDTKLRDGMTRWVLRAALTGRLPDRVRLRSSKANFHDEFRAALRQFLERAGPAPFAGLEAHVDLAAAEALLAALRDGTTDAVPAWRALWRLVVLRHWTQAARGWSARQARGELI